MGWLWLFGTFSGWLLRVQLKIIAIPFIALIRFISFGGLSQIGSGNVTKAERLEQDETRRMAGCKQVVLEYAEALGFIAREAISRDELEQLIDEGINPDDLAREIQTRIDKIPGIMLGHYHYANG